MSSSKKYGVHGEDTDVSINSGKMTKWSHVPCCIVVCIMLVILLFVFVAASLCVYFLVIQPNLCLKSTTSLEAVSPKKALENSEWGYTTVRPGINIFWWFYYAIPKSQHKEKPLVIWVQGGPGESGELGNFFQFGPYDENLMKRPNSWVDHANVLFIDNPVGTGYSYTTNRSLYVTETSIIVNDFLSTVKKFLKDKSQFQESPMYIFGESYGGKTGPILAKAIHQEVQQKKMKCNLVGIVIGGPAVHIPDFTSTYASYLYSLSLLDENQKKQLDLNYKKFRDAFDAKNHTLALEIMGKDVFGYLNNNIKGIDIYNVMTMSKRRRGNKTLNALMNGPIKQALGIIPEDKIWIEENFAVQAAAWSKVLEPVIKEVDYILKETSLKFVIYNGQLDLIVNAIGAHVWMKKLTWAGMTQYFATERKAIYKEEDVIAYVKTFGRLSFYWILNAGHQTARDAAETYDTMLRKIFGTNEN